MPREPAVPVEALLAQRSWVRALARTLVADGAAADDLEQEAWADALERPPAHGGSLRAWFAQVLRRRAKDSWRERARRDRREEAAARPEGTRSTTEVVAEADAHRRVVDAVMALEEPYRETILLRFFEDLPPRGVAARQGIPAETVRTRTRRALERLRERLDAESGGDRSAWTAALVPLTGGTVMAGKAAVAAVAVAAAIAGGVAGGIAVRPPAPADTAEVAALRARIEQLESRPAPAPTVLAEEKVEALQSRIARLEAHPPVAPAPAAAPAVEETPAQTAERERGAKESLAALERGRKAMDELQAKVEELRRQVLDRSLSDEERVKALMKLRYLPTWIDASVVTGVVAWFGETGTPATRDAILREIHGNKAPEFKALFTEALRSEGDEKVRARAAGDIDTWLEDPAVVQALEAARDGDASEAVRKAAARSLESKGKERK